MIADRFERSGGRPLWLTTLADLSLLLVGFFVFLQANRDVDARTLASGFRAGFDVAEAPALPPPVEHAVLEGFAPGAATLPHDVTRLLLWARPAARDPRITLRLTGVTDGSAADRDPATASADLLAVDRARAVAEMLIARGAVRASQIAIAPPGVANARGVRLESMFAGNRQDPAVRQPALAGL